jgi:hypothetical protein
MADPIQLESPQALINRARFAGKDFFTFVDDLVARLQILYVTEFNDFVSSGTGQMLIDIVCWAAETLSFYIDRQATESYIATARLRRSLNRLSRNIGYKPAAAVGASTDLEVLLNEIQAFDVPIEVGFQFQGPSDLIFEAAEEIIFPVGEGPLSPPRTVSVREGVTTVENFSSNGTRNQVFRLNPGEGKFVAGDSAIVTVDGSPWTESEIITFDQTDQFELEENAEPPLLRFGDGVAGNIPADGASIRIEYVATSGQAGLVKSNTITDVVDPLVVAFTNIEITITNPSPSSGGSNRESLDSIRANAPAFFKARNVAVTREDYEGLSRAYADPLAGAVAVAQAFVARGASEDLTLQILLQNIRDIIEPISANVQAETATARASLNSAESERSDIEDEVSNTIKPALDQIVTDPLTALPTGDAIDIRSEAESIRSDVTDSDVLADEGLGVSGDAAKNARLNSIKSELAGMYSRLDTIIARCGSIEQQVFDANEGITNVVTPGLATVSTNLTAALTDLDDIDTLIAAQFDTAVSDELDDIYAHVDGFLAADCQANLVQVPILTRDVDGFLQEPSIALQRSLERYLESRKEVTQVVEVMSGGNFLVSADITIVLGILDTYVQATVLSNARTAVDTLLKVRAFGRSLRLSDLYTILVPDRDTGRGGIEGVDFGVIRIIGDALFINADGNLIVTDQQVITKGTVTFTAQTVSATTGAISA